MIERMVVIDSAVRNRYGHFFVHTKGILEAGKKVGIPAVAIVHRDCDDAAEELGATRKLAFPAWGNEKLASFSYAALWTHANMVVLDSLDQIKSIISPSDLLVMHSASPNELFGIHKWYTSLDLSRPRLFICIHAPATHYASMDDKNIAESLFEKAMRLWAPILRDSRVVLATTTKALAQRIRTSFTVPITIMPLIVPVEGIKPIAQAERLRFLFSGFLKEKGLGILVQALQSLEMPPVTFVLHVGNEGVAAQCRQMFGDRKDVEILSKPLSPEEYNDLVSDCSALLLPYDPHGYDGRHSSMYFEALGSGRPVVVTSGTPMSDELIDAGLPGVVMKDWSSSALAEAIKKLHAEYGVRSHIAKQSARSIEEQHTAAAYVQRLLSWFK